MKKRLFFIAVIFLLNQAFNAEANSLKKIFEAGLNAYEKGNFAKAITLLEKVNEVYPKIAPSFYYLALSYQNKGAPEQKIIELLEKSVEIDPKYYLAYDKLGKIYYSQRKFFKAEDNLLKTLAINPNLISARLTLGWVYILGMSQPRDAIYHFNKVISKSKIAYAYLGLGISYSLDEQTFKSLEMITELRKLGADDYATQLENLVRDGKLPDSKPGTPLFKTQEDEDIFELEDDIEVSSPEEGTMKVRLKKENDVLTGSDRIKAMQKDSMKIYGEMGL